MEKKTDAEVNFALLIRKVKQTDGSIQMVVKSENQGISDTEVIFIVESWVEKVKERMKQKLMGGINFDEKV